MESFEFASYVRGYHAYQSKWTPCDGEVLRCFREPDNTEDKEAVAVKKEPHLDVLGHLPSYFNKFVFRFLRRSTNSACLTVTGKPVNRGAGLGMEVPCIYEFRGDSFSINWLRSKIETKKKYMDEACKEGRGKKRKM